MSAINSSDKLEKNINSQYEKLIKEISKLHQSYLNNIKVVKDNHIDETNSILQKISQDFDIPMSKLKKYYNQNTNDLKDDGVNNDPNNDSQVLIKITIKDKQYYIDNTNRLIYKQMKNKKIKKVGIVDENNNYILD
jgi:hypothetical protein